MKLHPNGMAEVYIIVETDKGYGCPMGRLVASPEAIEEHVRQLRKVALRVIVTQEVGV